MHLGAEVSAAGFAMAYIPLSVGATRKQNKSSNRGVQTAMVSMEQMSERKSSREIVQKILTIWKLLLLQPQGE